MCECDEIGSPWMLRLIRRTVVFCEDAADLRFEVGVKNSSEGSGTGPGCGAQATGLSRK